MQKQWLGTQVRYLDSPDDEPGSGWTRSELVPGTAGHFRATMERLYLQYRSDDGWTSSSGNKLTLGKNVHTDDKRGTWQIALRREDEPPCFAAIEAYEQPNGTTVVEFRDGREPGSQWRTSSIGSSFVEFSDVVIREAQPVEIAADDQGKVFQEEIELRPATDQQSVESESAAVLLQDMLPKRSQTLKRYKEAYSIIVKLRDEYRQLYEDDETAKPVPSMDDYREALGLRMSWKPSDPVVRKIIELGDEGLLKS